MIKKVDYKKKVLILLAACNGEKWIEQQISSILSQKNVDIYIRISVDFSKDKTFEICNVLSQKYKNIFLNQNLYKNSTASINFYNLILTADFNNYDYIGLSDQDDIWLEDKVYNAVKKIEEKNIDVYSSDAIAFWEKIEKQKYIKKSYKLKKSDFFFEAAGPGCTYLFNKNSFVFLKKFLTNKHDEILNIAQHDWLIYAILRSNKYRWYIHNKSYILYRQHKNNVFGANYGIKKIFFRIKLLFSGWYKNQIISIIKVIGADENNHIKKYFLDRVWYYRYLLIFKIREYRRRPRDVIVIFLILFFGFI